MDTNQQILQLTKYLIQMPTVSSNTEENVKALHFIMEYMDIPKNHMTYYKDTGNPSLVIAIQPHQKEFDVIFHAHVDVVPALPEAFIPQEKDGKLYGRGTLDMKGGLAAMMILLQQLIKQKTDKNIGLFITTDEEAGGYHGTHYLLNTLKYRSRFFISGEGAKEYGIVTKAKGMIRFILQAHGVSAHGGKVWLGDNAIDKLYKACFAIQQLFPEKKSVRSRWYSTLNVAKISGGEAINMVPKFAQAELDLRFTEEWKSADAIMKEIRAVLKNYKGVHLKETAIKDAMVNTSPNNPYVKKLQASLKKHVNQLRKPLGTAHGTSDARFASEVGIPAVEFGPQGSTNHIDDEYVELESLYTYYQILSDFVASLS